MIGWVGLVGRPTADGLSGHPSAAGRAQDSERSHVKDRRSTTVPRNQRGSRNSDRKVRIWAAAKTQAVKVSK